MALAVSVQGYPTVDRGGFVSASVTNYL